MIDIGQLIDQTEVDVAIIANLPSDHYKFAKKLLENNFHLLVEKPFTQTSEQASALIKLAEDRNLVLNVGHEYLLASYVHYFRQVLAKENPQPGFGTSKIEASWQDLPIEPRSGIVKQPDITTSVVEDLYPHILSQLTVLYGDQQTTLDSVDIADGGWTAEVNFHFGKLPVQLKLSRCATKTDRSLTVVTNKGAYRMDYSSEPATVSLDGQSLASDPTMGIMSAPTELRNRASLPSDRNAQQTWIAIG